MHAAGLQFITIVQYISVLFLNRKQLNWTVTTTVVQTYSKKAVDQVQEALTQAQKTHVLSQNIFEVLLLLMSDDLIGRHI